MKGRKKGWKIGIRGKGGRTQEKKGGREKVEKKELGQT